MNTVQIDYEDAQAIAQNIEEHLQYDGDDDKEFWETILNRLKTQLWIAETNKLVNNSQ